MVLAQAIDRQGLIVGSAAYNADEGSISIIETPRLVAVKQARACTVSRPVTQVRLDGQLRTHTSICYYATADRVMAALAPQYHAVDGFQLVYEAERSGYDRR